MTRLFERPIAHRGLHDRAAGIIENSRAAFAAAMEHGYAVECDVQLSSDGVPFTFHDDSFDRLTGVTGASGDRPIAEVQALVLTGSAGNETPQRLTEFLAQIGGRVQLQVELKQQPTAERTEALASAVAKAIAGYRGPLTLESFDPRLVAAVRRAGVIVPVGIVTYGYNEPDWDGGISPFRKFILRHLLHWPWTRFDFISARNTDLALPAIRFWRRRGMEVTAWTITTAAAARAASAHADQIVFEGFLPESG